MGIRLYIGVYCSSLVCVEEQGSCSLVPKLSPHANGQATESWVGPGNEAKASVVCSIKHEGEGIMRPKFQTVVASFSIPLLYNVWYDTKTFLHCIWRELVKKITLENNIYKLPNLIYKNNVEAKKLISYVCFILQFCGVVA